MAKVQDSFTFTVGKLDAGMAILLGERAHLIEFPSVLLPPGATAGSIVNIAVHQNHAEEKKRDAEFWALQDDIMNEFGRELPDGPDLRLRNITQTSVTLEWPPIKLATAKLRSLDIYRNGQRLAAIPSPMTNLSTKVSGLELETEYTFQLILRTTAGTFPSQLLRVRTHSMANTSGIRVCFGTVQDERMLEDAKLALEEMGARWSDKIEIDTTHFICTTPASIDAAGQGTSAPGVLYQRALQLSIPVLQPQWILACHAKRSMMPVAPFYLGAGPAASASTPAFRPQSMSQANINSPVRQSATSPNRMSMPVQARSSQQSPPAVPPQDSPHSASSTFVGQPPETVAEEDEGGPGEDVAQDKTRKRRSGTMNRDFKFPVSPSPGGSPVVPAPPVPALPKGDVEKAEEGKPPAGVVTPSSIEVPPPPPVEKERSVSSGQSEDIEEDVGPTEEISLN